MQSPPGLRAQRDEGSGSGLSQLPMYPPLQSDRVRRRRPLAPGGPYGDDRAGYAPALVRRRRDALGGGPSHTRQRTDRGAGTKEGATSRPPRLTQEEQTDRR